MGTGEESLEKTTKKFIRDVILSAVGSGVLLAIGYIWRFIPLDILVSIVATFFITSSVWLFINRRNKASTQISELGIVGMWRDEEQFKKFQGVSYTEYCRQFIKEAQDGKTIRVVGYDWVEIFPDTIVLDKDIFGENGTSRLRFEVILGDPKAPIAVEKRAWEMTWKSSSGEALYPEGTGKDSLFRLKTKIESCVTVAKIFAHERPQYFQLKLTPVLLNYAFIMRDDKVIVVFYGLPWKGKDSLIIEARKNQRKTAKGSGRTKSIYGNDLYGFLEGFFDAIWNEPNWRFVELTEADKK